MEHKLEKFELLKSFLLTLAFVLWIYWLWSRRFLYQFAFQLPGIFGLPIAGVFVIRILNPKNLFLVFEKMFKECKSYTISIWMGLVPVMLTSDPYIVEKILSTTDFLHKPIFYRPLLSIKGGTLFASPPDIWHHNRKVILPSFSHKVLVKFFPIFHKAKVLGLSKFDNMVGKGEHQIRPMLRRLGLGISVETTMGKILKEGDQVDEELVENISSMIDHTMLSIILSFLNLDRVYRYFYLYQRSINYFYNYVKKLVENKLNSRADVKNNNNLSKLKGKAVSEDETQDMLLAIKKNPNIFIDQAIVNYEKKQFSWNDILCESGTLIIASFESSASVVLASIVMLAMHPEYQERLFEELAHFYPDKDFEMEYEHLKQLPYLTMVINESLRLIPSVPLFGRHVAKDIQLTQNIFLPKDLQIIIDIFHLQRRTDIWGPNATKFDPDHFLPENLTHKHSYAFLPFSKGFRNCIGYRYAYYSISVLLAGFIRNFRFTTTFKYEDLKFYNHIAIKFTVEPGIEVHRRETLGIDQNCRSSI